MEANARFTVNVISNNGRPDVGEIVRKVAALFSS